MGQDQDADQLRRFTFRAVTFAGFMLLLLPVNYGANRWLFARASLPFDDAPVWIVGDSHAMYAFDVELLPGSVNLAQVAEHYLLTYHKLGVLQPRSNGVERLILSLSPHNLSEFNDYKFVDSFHATELLGRAAEVMSMADIEPFQVERSTARRAWGERWWLRPRPPDFDRLIGYDGPVQNAPPPLDQVIARHYERDGRPLGPSATMTAMLDSILELADQAGLDLVIVVPPVQEAYQVRVPDDVMSHFEAAKTRLAASGLRVLDYFQADFEPEDFMDWDHLSPVGARRFTTMVADDLGGASH